MNEKKKKRGSVPCQHCERTFSQPRYLAKHVAAFHTKPLTCEDCGATFSRADNLRRHQVRIHEKEIKDFFACGICEKVFRSEKAVQEHRHNQHIAHHDFRLVESALGRQTQVLRAFIPEDIAGGMDRSLLYCYSHLLSMLKEMKSYFNYFKVSSTLHVELARYGDEGELTELKVFPFRSYSFAVPRLMSEKRLEEESAMAMGDFERSIDEFLNCGSGWTVVRTLFMDSEVAQCRPLAGYKCNLHMAKYNKAESTISAENFTNRRPSPTSVSCFYQAVAAAFLRPSDYGREEALSEYARSNFTFLPGGADAAVSVEDIAKFEQLNSSLRLNIAVLYRDESGQVVPVRGGGKEAEEGAVNITLLLFFLPAEDSKSGKVEDSFKAELHYAFSPSPQHMLARRTRLTSGKLQTYPIFLCFTCLSTQVREREKFFRETPIFF